ncbi:DUF3126 family protein [Acidiphilium sp.]|uniref:DUF3126 family protein n=1 Tax=Acidiphilium sp. TaxID=527 RepID=UPI00258CAC5B|nr:DUF3126 family protein [Acidiphilium sp.]
MNPTDLARLEAYLRTTLGNPRLRLDAPKARGASVELRLGEEFLGTVHRDDEDGEVSFSIHITVLDEDLPRMAAPPPAPKRPAPRR